MALPSERFGKILPRSVIQVESFDEPTRIALWNIFLQVRGMVEESYGGYSAFSQWLQEYWSQFLHKPLDTFETQSAWISIRKVILGEEWVLLLDELEILAKTIGQTQAVEGDAVAKAFNATFNQYLVGYRFVDLEIVSVTEQSEVEAIESAIDTVGAAARAHTRRALELLGERHSPKYSKVIAESIHAVEAAVRELTGKSVLSEGLKQLSSKGVEVHPAILAAWDKLYGYTSDAKGIRHALVRDEDSDEALASYFVVVCSAFINMLLKKAAG
jgi:hypothetical protein